MIAWPRFWPYQPWAAWPFGAFYTSNAYPYGCGQYSCSPWTWYQWMPGYGSRLPPYSYAGWFPRTDAGEYVPPGASLPPQPRMPNPAQVMRAIPESQPSSGPPSSYRRSYPTAIVNGIRR